jgi:hypothetical protein
MISSFILGPDIFLGTLLLNIHNLLFLRSNKSGFRTTVHSKSRLQDDCKHASIGSSPQLFNDNDVEI